MCGIIGIIGKKCITKSLIESLKNLTNRGYDSVGVYMNEKIIKHISSKNSLPVTDVENETQGITSKLGIGHTRWATHGAVTIENAHPHISNNKQFVLVHNGVITNYMELKLIEHFYSGSVVEAIRKTIGTLDGTYGICLYKKGINKLYCFKNGSPLVIAKTNDYLMVSSEITGFNNMVKTYNMLENGDICILDGTGDLKIVTDIIYNSKEILNDANIEKNEEHWTLSEINDQKNSLQRIINYGGRIKSPENVILGGLKMINKTHNLRSYKTLLLIGCGTSYFAAKVGAYYFKNLTDFESIMVIDGCEMVSSDVPNHSIAILLSQSGETRDLIVCMETLREKNTLILGCINKVDSYLAVKADAGIYLNAGIERGVASTKSFTSQLVGLKLIALQLSELSIKGNVLVERTKDIAAIMNISNNIDYVLRCDKIVKYAEKIKNKRSMFLLGKGKYYPIMEEGALKIKELSYIHAEAYSGSALKHGPFSLLEEGFPVILIIHMDQHYTRMRTTYEEIKARGGDILIITNDNSFPHEQKIVINQKRTIFEIQYIILLQRLAYFLSIKRGINPDYPRNLAKVVTVE